MKRGPKSIAFIDDQQRYLFDKYPKPTGGAAVQTYAWIHGFLALGWNVEILTPYDGLFANRKVNGVEFVLTYNSNVGIRRIRWFYYRLPQIYRAIIMCKSKVLYSSIPSNINFLLALVSNLSRKFFIQRVSNDFFVDERLKQKKGLFSSILIHLGYQFSDLILVQNKYQYTKLRKKFPLKNIIHLNNPFYGNIKNNFNNFAEREYIAWVGIFQYQKNLPLLLDIASKNPTLLFKIAGTEIDNIDLYTIKAINELSALKNVEFVGFVDRENIQGFLEKATALLNTSHYEGFSNTYLEAFSVGTPVVCPTQNDPNEVVSAENLGITYDPNDFNREKLFSFLLDTAIYSLYSSNCIKYLKRNHCPQLIARHLINEVCNKNFIHVNSRN